ncbi:uncharacterized protein LOC120659800 isoform X2 [Panicum virgatum]|uniref:uncharacterized protein LOC120659800 isoform X2 n=1 Tax=Panicum virgatum TaxID=38727 RepID=UPI0019D65DF7|nr:uncharacterized protein LOC120659800 isoform X2 [Panicum virgatum]
MVDWWRRRPTGQGGHRGGQTVAVRLRNARKAQPCRSPGPADGQCRDDRGRRLHRCLCVAACRCRAVPACRDCGVGARCARRAAAWLLPAFSSCGMATNMKSRNRPAIDSKLFIQKTDAKKRTKENNQANQKIRDWEAILQFNGARTGRPLRRLLPDAGWGFSSEGLCTTPFNGLRVRVDPPVKSLRSSFWLVGRSGSTLNKRGAVGLRSDRSQSTLGSTPTALLLLPRQHRPSSSLTRTALRRPLQGAAARPTGGPRRGRQGAARAGPSCHAKAAARAGSLGAASSALISRGRDRRSGDRRGGGPCVPLPCGSTSSHERLEILDDERRVLCFRVVGWEIHGSRRGPVQMGQHRETIQH